MSLSAAEKVRVVQALDRLGVHFIEAGFPSSNPKEAELFELLAEIELEQAQVCAFGMTRRRGLAAEDDPALRSLVGSAAPVVTFVGKTWALHLEKVTKVSPEENLTMIVDSVNYARAEGKRVIYDAEHFFDAWRDDAGYALECLRAAVAAGAENVTLCDTNGSSLPAEVAAATASVLTELGERAEIGIHTHNDLECGVANSLAAVEAGARLVQGTINGYGERCGNANLVSILPALQLKLGYRVRARGPPQAAHRDRPFRRRADQHDPRPRPALRRPQRVRPQGRDARRRRPGRRAHLRAHGPEADRQQPRRADLGAVRQGLGALEGRGRRDRARRRRGEARGRADQGARAPRLPLRGGRRLVRAAAEA